MRTRAIILSLMGFVFESLAANWYVDSLAVGSANGTSEANAWTDTSGVNGPVWASIGSGDTLWIKGNGQSAPYGELEIGTGETGVTVKIIQDSTEQAVFTFSDLLTLTSCTIDGFIGTNNMFKVLGKTDAYTESGSLMRLRSCSQFTIRGVDLDRSVMFNTDSAVVNGILVNNSTAPPNDQVLIEDCSIIYVRGDGININNPGPSTGYDRYIIQRVRVVNTGDDAVQHSGNTTVANCYFDKNGQAPLHGGHQDGVQMGVGCLYGKIINNTIIGYSQGIFVEEANGYVQLYNNLLIGDGATTGSQRGIVAGVQNTNSFTGEFVVANNVHYNFLTFTGAQHGSLALAILAGGVTVKYFGGNIYINCKTAVQADSSLLDASNLYWDLPGVQYYDTDGNPVSTPSDRQAGSSVYADPLMVDPENRDFQLMASSPARGLGTDFSEWFTTDILGVTRSAWDAGAFEFQGAAISGGISVMGGVTIQ